MLREHAPLIAVAVLSAVLFYLLFRDVRSLRADVELLGSQLAQFAADPLPQPDLDGPDALSLAPAAAPPTQRVSRQRQASPAAPQAGADPSAAPAVADAAKPAGKRA